jgi:anti-sigma factor RsiW
MRLFNFDDPQHREAIELLPWYVNGTLAGIERARVERHVQECVACRRELEAQRRVHDLVLDHAAYPASEAALARLHAELDARSRQGSGAGRSGSAPGRRMWPGSWLGWALAAQLGALLIGIVVWPYLHSGGEFHTLATPAASRTSPDAVVVVFDGTATRSQIDRLLRELNARIVDGPNLRDAYTLDLPAGAQAKALETLRGVPWVRFAQPAPGSRGTQP